MEIIFIRHGQTDVNKANCLQGANVDAELNENGRNYAKKAAQKFDPSEFDYVFTSPLKRAVETAEIFTKGQKNLVPDQRLVEFDFGDWDGKPMDEIAKQHPDVIDPWGKINRNYVKYAPHGESYEDFEKRCASFLDEVYQKYPEDKILVVAHGRLIRAMAAYYLNSSMDQLDTVDNCALTKFSVRKKQARLVYYNRVL